MQTREGFAPFGAWQTWYRITGDLASGQPPLIVVHGGPGCTHDYVDSFKALAGGGPGAGRAVIHYDQLGNGRSTHLPDRGAAFWTVDLFLAELDNLIAHLGLAAGGYDLLGQSWGGMLGAEFALRRPAGLRALVIADSPASMELWVREAGRLRAALPEATRRTLEEHEAAGSTNSAPYLAATEEFYARHVCRVVPNPPEVERTNQAMRDDPTVYRVMNGPNEFHVIGTLRDWSVIGRLDRIAVPTLLISGAHDEATPATMQPFADAIPDVRWHIFPESSHMPHVEEFDACMQVVGGFLDACRAREGAGAQPQAGAG